MDPRRGLLGVDMGRKKQRPSYANTDLQAPLPASSSNSSLGADDVSESKFSSLEPEGPALAAVRDVLPGDEGGHSVQDCSMVKDCPVEKCQA